MNTGFLAGKILYGDFKEALGEARHRYDLNEIKFTLPNGELVCLNKTHIGWVCSVERKSPPFAKLYTEIIVHSYYTDGQYGDFCSSLSEAMERGKKIDDVEITLFCPDLEIHDFSLQKEKLDNQTVWVYEDHCGRRFLDCT